MVNFAPVTEELNLVRDLAVILISAGVVAIISKALKQPLILGYIIAGFLVGPNFPYFPGITSTQTVQQWSDIGIIFLMFALGLEFSFKKLLKAGGTALTVAAVKFLGVFVLGFVVGQAMRWTTMESIFLAGLLSMSSTMVVVKSYDEMSLMDKPWASGVFGTLVVEDLIAILLMVLLSTMAVSNKFAGGEMILNLAKLVFFIVLCFLVGIYVIPTLLRKARAYISDEVLLIVSIGLCFGMVALAEVAGFSSALGAFLMGSILAETMESERIDRLVLPIKNLFGAIFFVSVGMMLSPTVIARHWAVILLITLLVYFGHIFFAGVGVILSGGGLENAVHTGFSLAQLGEFGFIIAGVGVSLGVMRDFIYPVIIAVSVITTFTTPYMIKAANPTYAFLRKRLPAKWLSRLDAQDSRENRSEAEKNEWKKLFKAYFLRVFLYVVLILGVMLLCQHFLDPLADKLLVSLTPLLRNVIVTVVTLALMAPFLYGLAVNSGSISAPAAKLLAQKKSNALPIFGLVLGRIFIAVAFVIIVISGRFTLSWWSILLIILGAGAFFLASRRSIHRFSSLEKRFFTNLNARESSERNSAPVSTEIRSKLAGYDVHIETLQISPDSTFVGSKLSEVGVRGKTGANILKIIRGHQSILLPSSSEVLYPDDKILAVGTSDQISSLKALFEQSVKSEEDHGGDEEFEVDSFTLRDGSYLTGKTLRDAALRDYRCMVVSVLRDSQFVTNPKPDFRFREGDTVWVAGLRSCCEWLH